MQKTGCLNSFFFNLIFRLLPALLPLVTCAGQQPASSNPLPAEARQEKPDPAKPGLARFLPDNFSILDSAAGDLNRDNISDLIIVLKRNDEDSISAYSDSTIKRPLLIFIRNRKGQLRLAGRNDNMVYCRNCGGMMGDPYTGISISNGSFSVEHYGGSVWRWSRSITFRYSTREKKWLLYRDESESFHALHQEKTKVSIRTRRNFGRVPFEKFDIYQDQ